MKRPRWGFQAALLIACAVTAGALLSRWNDPEPPDRILSVQKLIAAGAHPLEEVRKIEPSPELPKGTRVIVRAAGETQGTTAAEPVACPEAPPAWVVKPENLGATVSTEVVELGGVWAVTIKAAGFLNTGNGTRISGPMKALDVLNIAQIAPRAIPRTLPWEITGGVAVTTDLDFQGHAAFFPRAKRWGPALSYDTGGEIGAGIAFRLGPR